MKKTKEMKKIKLNQMEVISGGMPCILVGATYVLITPLSFLLNSEVERCWNS